ncbi:MAG: class I SAM-dependent methyltransferase [Cyclobacteriaceae bacterium]
MNKLIHFLKLNIPRPILIRLSYEFKGIFELEKKKKKHTCPISEKSYRTFLPYGAHTQRPNVLCPGNYSLERHRLLWLYLQQKTDFFTSPKRMLHVAPEQCYYKKFKDRINLDYTTADLYSPLADIKMDLHDIPLEDNMYDVIFCNHVMEHVDDDHRCMSELYRVLKPGGFAILQVPQDFTNEETLEDPAVTDPKERERLYWQQDHVRLYGKDYGKRLQKAGFTVKEDYFASELSEEDIERYRISPAEIIYFCTKE